MAEVERVEGRDVRRTGWVTDARRCPDHGEQLELCFDETDFTSWSPEHQVPFNHDDDRIRWRCDQCVGSWLESFFLEGRREPPRATRLLLTCPSCGGRRVTHDCVPECCDGHVCVDCLTSFSARVEVVEPGPEAAASAEPDAPAYLIMATGQAPDPRYRSGWSRPFRACPSHGSALELVFVALGSETPHLLAWHCADCARSWTEPHFRIMRRWFAPDATPGVQCPQCFRSQCVSRGDPRENLALCETCRIGLRIRLEHATPPRVAQGRE